jgi:ABC-2 type transport system permease protein
MVLNKLNNKINKTDLSIAILLVLGILIVVNFFAYQIFYRWDLTKNKVYSLSAVTKKTISQVDDVINIKAYFTSEGLPSQMIVLRQDVSDILKDYESYGKGRIKTEMIDPAKDETTQRDLQMKGIPQLTFEVYEKDQMKMVNGYMGIEISYGDKSEIIPAIQGDISDMEYRLTTAIKKLTVKDLASVGYLTSQGTANLENDVPSAYKKLQELYNVKEVALTDKDNTEIPTDIKTLIIIGPKEAFSEDSLKTINNFVAKGHSLIVLLDGVKIDKGLIASKNETMLDTLLEKYGVTVKKDIVADESMGMASFSQGFISFSTPYPYWPKITKDGFNKNVSAVSSLQNVVLPWPSSVEADEAKLGKGNITYLANTTDKAWSQTDNYNVSPQGNQTKNGSVKKYNLAVLVNGGMTNPYGKTKDEKINSRMIVVGDSDFINDGFVRSTPDNLTFFQNLVDTLSFDEDLIKIRSKVVSDQPIKSDLTDAEKMSYRYFNVFGITALVLIFGLARYYLRRKPKFIDEL